MLMKLILAASAAIIMGLILFLPRTNRAQVRPNTNASAQARHNGQALESIVAILPAPTDDISRRSAELRERERKRSEEVQSALRSLLASPAKMAEARELLEVRRREVLRAKLLVLGDELLSGSNQAEAHQKRVLEALGEELDTLSKQRELLSQLMKKE